MIEFETIDEFIDEFYIDCKCLIDGDKTKITKDIINFENKIENVKTDFDTIVDLFN